MKLVHLIGRYSLSAASGPSTKATEARSRNRSPVLTSSIVGVGLARRAGTAKAITLPRQGDSSPQELTASGRSFFAELPGPHERLSRVVRLTVKVTKPRGGFRVRGFAASMSACRSLGLSYYRSPSSAPL
jgi:hypothetical protein